MIKTNVIKKNYVFLCTNKNTGEKKRMTAYAESLTSAQLKLGLSDDWMCEESQDANEQEENK